jgi:endonuclease III
LPGQVVKRTQNTKKPGSRLVARAAVTLPKIDRLLRSVYKTRSLGNKRNPLDELVYAQLSVRTPESTYMSTYGGLRQAVGGVWERLLSIPDHKALAVLAPGGMGKIKLKRLRGIMEAIQRRFGRVSLADLRSMSEAEAEAELCALPGIGPKVARCVLLYSLDRQVFPVDSHCYRVLRRLGYVPPWVDRKSAHRFLQELIPGPIRHSLHVNLVHHGRRICTPIRPSCSKCPLLALCPTGIGLLREIPTGKAPKKGSVRV